jgi:hypothetical protein
VPSPLPKDAGYEMGALADDFKLQAIYRNFVLATDHTALKGSIVGG